MEIFKKFKSMVERQSDHKIKNPKINGRCEYVSNDFQKNCNQDCTWGSVTLYTSIKWSQQEE